MLAHAPDATNAWRVAPAGAAARRCRWSWVVLVVPAAWVEFGGRDAPWWLQGASLVVGATGLALFWTGLTGPSPDWVDSERL